MCIALKCVRCSWNIFYQNYVFKLNVANSSTSIGSVPKIILQRSRRLWYIHISFSKTIIKMIATQVSPQYEPANWSCIFWIFFGACPKILRQQSRFCSLLKCSTFLPSHYTTVVWFMTSMCEPLCDKQRIHCTGSPECN